MGSVYRSAISLVAFCCVLLVGCTGLRSAFLPHTSSALSIVGVETQANGVAPNRAIGVQFSNDMDQRTINAATFLLVHGNTNVQGMVEYNADSRIALFRPASGMDTNASYTATITTGVTDVNGQHLSSNFSWSFTTRATADTSPLEVVATVPRANENCVQQNIVIGIQFDEGADPTTINTSSFLVSGASGPVSGAVTYDVTGNTADFTPSHPLDANTRYTVTITAAAKDLAEVPLSAPFTFSFTTGPCAAAPPLAATYVPLDFPAASSTTATGVNNHSDVVGYYSLGTSVHGFLFSGGVFTTIDVPGAQATLTGGVNDSGDIVGHWFDQIAPGHNAHAFLRHSGAFTMFDYPGAIATLALGINGAGVIAGNFVAADGSVHGFIRQPDGTLAQFSPPAATNDSANGINYSGHIAGDTGNGATGYIFANSSFQAFQVQGAATRANGINDLDQIAGNYLIPGSHPRGFFKDANNLFTVEVPGSIATSAQGVNNGGVIVGSFVDAAEKTHGFVATRQ